MVDVTISKIKSKEEAVVTGGGEFGGKLGGTGGLCSLLVDDMKLNYGRSRLTV